MGEETHGGAGEGRRRADPVHAATWGGAVERGLHSTGGRRCSSSRCRLLLLLLEAHGERAVGAPRARVRAVQGCVGALGVDAVGVAGHLQELRHRGSRVARQVSGRAAGGMKGASAAAVGGLRDVPRLVGRVQQAPLLVVSSSALLLHHRPPGPSRAAWLQLDPLPIHLGVVEELHRVGSGADVIVLDELVVLLFRGLADLLQFATLAEYSVQLLVCDAGVEVKHHKRALVDVLVVGVVLRN
mmetsp:Transcript_35597/g.100750  ORF Transcript_35597/g.100750 Transcript_35597/m.100750 type:complete len:242 (+) Transcript_35597:1833-2558(+)